MRPYLCRGLYNVVRKNTINMRKITQLAINAFNSATPFNCSNTTVTVLPHVTILSLHGNNIAFKYNYPRQALAITNCGWFSNTTKERLNAIEGVSIYQKKGVWFLNGAVWDGSLIEITQK